MAKKIVITGAAGQIAYSLVFRIAKGELLGEKTPIQLRLLETKESVGFLRGVKMEIEDCAFPLVESVHTSCDAHECFEGADYLFLVGSKPRGPGMERKDLLIDNGKIFIEQGRALNKASQNAITLVVGNPCNTNALILKRAATHFPSSRIFAMTKLDELRAKSFIASKLNLNVSAVDNLVIWGNHSKTQVIDFVNATVKNKPLESCFDNKSFLETDLQKTIQDRGAEVIAARGKSSAASAANAALETMKDLIYPTPKGKVFSTSVYSRGNPYGIDEDLFFSQPCISLGEGKIEVVKGYKINDFLRDRLKVSEKELLEERLVIDNLLH